MVMSSTAASCGSGKTYTASIFSLVGLWNVCVTFTRAMKPEMSATTSVCSSGHSINLPPSPGMRSAPWVTSLSTSANLSAFSAAALPVSSAATFSWAGAETAHAPSTRNNAPDQPRVQEAFASVIESSPVRRLRVAGPSSARQGCCSPPRSATVMDEPRRRKVPDRACSPRLARKTNPGPYDPSLTNHATGAIWEAASISQCPTPLRQPCCDAAKQAKSSRLFVEQPPRRVVISCQISTRFCQNRLHFRRNHALFRRKKLPFRTIRNPPG